jgi:Obg family GTPase CgtA
VIFEVDEQLATLRHLAGKDRFLGERGRIGGRNKRHEADRKPLIVKVPKGTVVWVRTDDYRLLSGRQFYGEDAALANRMGISNDPKPYKNLEARWPWAIFNSKFSISNQLSNESISNDQKWVQIADLDKPGDRVVVARGGRGGLGNATFAKSRFTAPKLAHKGEWGELWRVRLELKVLADVGFVGLPNVGKSSLLAVLTAAKPEIANYPFTTITPNLGVLRQAQDKLIIADIPGLIEDAHAGKGLGVAFLKHIERCKVLVYVLAADVRARHTSPVQEELWEQYQIVRREVEAYGRGLADKPFVVAINKCDLITDYRLQITENFEQKGVRPVMVSALTGEGLEEMVEVMVEVMEELATSD